MSIPTKKFSSSRTSSTPFARPIICVVDPSEDDYTAWRELAAASGVDLQILATVDDALRMARRHPVALWVVNAELPGSVGSELCGMLKAVAPATTIYMVADEYSIERERAAWRAGVTMFGCKPAHIPWLGAWIEHRQGRRPSECRPIAAAI